MSLALPIKIIQGTSASITIYLTDGDTGKPRDLTNVTEVVAKVPGSSGTSVVQRLTTSGITLLTPKTSGGFRIDFTSVNTAAMALTVQTIANTTQTATALHFEVTDPTDPNWMPRSQEVANALNIVAPSAT